MNIDINSTVRRSLFFVEFAGWAMVFCPSNEDRILLTAHLLSL